MSTTVTSDPEAEPDPFAQPPPPAAHAPIAPPAPPVAAPATPQPRAETERASWAGILVPGGGIGATVVDAWTIHLYGLPLAAGATGGVLLLAAAGVVAWRRSGPKAAAARRAKRAARPESRKPAAGPRSGRNPAGKAASAMRAGGRQAGKGPTGGRAGGRSNAAKGGSKGAAGGFGRVGGLAKAGLGKAGGAGAKPTGHAKGKGSGKPTGARSALGATAAGARRAARATHTAARATGRGAAATGRAAARGALAAGRAATRLQRHAARVRRNARGPAWWPHLAHGLGRALRPIAAFGRWLRATAAYQHWLLLAGNDRDTAPAATEQPAEPATPAETGPTPQPGRAVPVPNAPQEATVSVHRIQDLTEAIADIIGAYEPEDPLELRDFLTSLPEVYSSLGTAMTGVADRLGDDLEVSAQVRECLQESGVATIAAGQWLEMIPHVYAVVHEHDVHRHEQPRQGEATFWSPK